MAVDGAKAWLVASREYVENVRTRGFWLSLLMMPLLLLLVSVVPVLLAGSEPAVRYAVLDQSGWVQHTVAVRVAGSDATLLVDALAQMQVDQRPPAIADMPPVDTADERSRLASATAAIFVQLQSGGVEPELALTAAHRIAHWWRHDPQAASRIAPAITSTRYEYIATPGLGRTELNQRLVTDDLLGYFVIPDNLIAGGHSALYVTRKLTNLEVRNWYASLVTDVVRDRKIREEDISPSTANWIQAPVLFDTTRLTDSGAETDAELADTLTQWAPVAFVYLLWISIFSITQMLLTNTVEEKSNKLVEVLLSSIAPVDLMAGKILGIAATGITIVAAWLALFLALVLWLPGWIGVPIGLDLTVLVDRPIYLVSFLVYFVLGYLFYAALLCGIGSLANNLKEAQALMMPIQLLLVVPLIVMVPIGRNPHGMLAQVMSWLPPFTPFVMMNRAAFPPGIGTYIGTSLLLLVSIYLALALAARVFQTGILMTGKPPRLRQLLELLRRNGP